MLYLEHTHVLAGTIRQP